MFQCTKSVKFHFRWGTKPRDQKQETENDCDVISELQALQISTTFSYFLINNALLYHFLANWLAHNNKMTEKSVFREGWSPEMTSQSFPVSCFWSRGFVQFWCIKTRVRKIAIESFSLLYISVHWDLMEQITKKSVTYTLTTRVRSSSRGPFLFWRMQFYLQAEHFHYLQY